jgi:hypothetical protein
MGNHLERILTRLDDSIRRYRADKESLNSLVRSIEGLLDAVDSMEWKEKTFRIFEKLEIINALSLHEARTLRSDEAEAISGYLVEMEDLARSIRHELQHNS